MPIIHQTTDISAPVKCLSGEQYTVYHENTKVLKLNIKGIRFYSSSSFTVKLANSNGETTWDGKIQYSYSGVDSGWSDYNTGTVLTSQLVNYGDGLFHYEIYFRGVNNTQISNGSYYSTFTLDGSDIYCDGDLLYLLHHQADSSYSASDGTYYRLFCDCTNLKQAPKMTLATLPSFCYYYTYFGCTGLTVSPTLSYTGFASGSYYNCAYMFYNCRFTSVTMPALTTFTNYCYNYMFSDCINLTAAPRIIPANTAATIGTYGFSYMFQNCTSLIDANFVANATVTVGAQSTLVAETTLSTYSLAHMFRGCTSLEYANVVTLPYKSIIKYRLTALAPTTLASNCYRQMYYGCTALKMSSIRSGNYSHVFRIPKSGSATGTTTNATYLMFTNTSGTFKSTPNLGTTYYGYVPGTNTGIIDPIGPVTPILP